MRRRVVGLGIILLLGAAALYVSPYGLPDTERSSIASFAEGHVMGGGAFEAPVKITVFTDFECPYCKDFHERFYGRIKNSYGSNIVVRYKNFPRDEHPHAYIKAQIAECIARLYGEPAYWQYVDSLFAHEQSKWKTAPADAAFDAARTLGFDRNKIQNCIDDGAVTALIDAHIAEGKTIPVKATPGVLVEGAGESIMIDGNRGNGTRTAIELILTLLKNNRDTAL